jgi:hypothetical protein
MATPIFPVPNSPTMSSASSFDVLSLRSRSSTTSSEVFIDDSDDEIVWGQSDDSLLDSGPASDDDFVVLSRPRSPRASVSVAPPPAPTDNLVSDLARLSVNEVSSIIRKNKKAAAAAAKVQDSGIAAPKRASGKSKPNARLVSQPHSPSACATPVSERPSSVATLRKGSTSPSGKARRRRTKKSGSQSPTSTPGSPLFGSVGLGARSIVDDISERASECGGDEEIVPGMYDAAASYINSCISDPSSVCRLTLLQALIIELGLASSSLPASLTQAKAVLKSRVFVNVGEYLDARQRGPAAVQGIIHSSKSSLLRDLRTKRNHVPLQRVKESGLGVLLVRSYYH